MYAYVCVYVCVLCGYACMCLYVDMCVHLCKNKLCVYVCVCVYCVVTNMRVCVSVNLSKSIFISVRVCVCIYKGVHICLTMLLIQNKYGYFPILFTYSITAMPPFVEHSFVTAVPSCHALTRLHNP